MYNNNYCLTETIVIRVSSDEKKLIDDALLVYNSKVSYYSKLKRSAFLRKIILKGITNSNL